MSFRLFLMLLGVLFGLIMELKGGYAFYHDLGLSWTVSSLMNKFLIVTCSWVGMYLLVVKSENIALTIGVNLFFLSSTILSFTFSSHNFRDYMSSNNSPITKHKESFLLKDIISKNPKFEGVVCLSNKDCTQTSRLLNDLTSIERDRQFVQVVPSKGQASVFVYVKRKQVLNYWSSSAFGFKALDWIEQELRRNKN